MLVHDEIAEIQNSSGLDQILYDGDTLYNRIVDCLKEEGKFADSLLSLEEIPDSFEIDWSIFCRETTHKVWYSCEYFRR